MSEVVVNGRRLPLSRALVRRVVETVLRGERRDALISITFLGPGAMRRLNAEHKGSDRPTDVLAFPLEGPAGEIVGDVYICPAIARQQARALRIPPKQELIRLVIHGTLHALGLEHPEGPGRIRSRMWLRQERYVEGLT
ncbi:MAG TPA: rRNA maturation RNase YbeY [Gemmatimonadales bacterium]|nr:rRNA maturation RNase YbeY [Gemmatimonadales bacterium]